ERPRPGPGTRRRSGARADAPRRPRGGRARAARGGLHRAAVEPDVQGEPGSAARFVGPVSAELPAMHASERERRSGAAKRRARRMSPRRRGVLAACGVAAAAAVGVGAFAQVQESTMTSLRELSARAESTMTNPYRMVENWP